MKTIYPEPIIAVVTEKKLVGQRVAMSLAENKISALWRSFISHLKDIQKRTSNEMISMSVYSELLQPGDFNQKFDKWAAVEVSDFNNVPEGTEKFTLKGGLYAVFHYQGLSTDNSIFINIFSTWLPSSHYELDDRPHFEILGSKYKNGDPNSQEDIYIPIKSK